MATEREVRTGAGLTALVVYRRPAFRRAILGELADLGVFVVEYTGGNGWTGVANMAGADVAILVAGDETDAILAADMASRCPVVVCCTANLERRLFLDAGAHACVTDTEFVRTAPGLLAAAALAARTGNTRLCTLHVGPATFDPQASSLVGADRTVTLSRSERAVLLRLIEAGGNAVNAVELARIAAPAGLELRPGFLKATILRLRRKLDIVGASPAMIRTVRGVGYALCAEPSAADLPRTGA